MNRAFTRPILADNLHVPLFADERLSCGSGFDYCPHR